MVGIVAAILLAAGLLPPYREIWKRRGRVIGINWVGITLVLGRTITEGAKVFLSMDWFGAVFSLMALGESSPATLSTNTLRMHAVAQHTFDILGGVLYILW